MAVADDNITDDRGNDMDWYEDKDPRLVEPVTPSEGREHFFAIRRVDGDLLYGEYGWVNADNDHDWSGAEYDADESDSPIEYELVRMNVEVIGRRTLPLCKECDEPATHWGLCEAHAREDDPESFPDA